jgi:ATP-dependent exoDNAse (exonuclease V) beta subunit
LSDVIFAVEQAVMLADEPQRVRILTDLDSNLLVEAAAGTGKTSLLAGRIAMLLASGRTPRCIAAITFTELAAGELALRIHSYVAALLAGKIPNVMMSALPQGLSAKQHASLTDAQQHLDEITTSTIHGFCQEIIRSYAVETALDPGSSVIDAATADTIFESVFSTWLVDRLSASRHLDDPVAVLSQHDPLKVVGLIKELGDLKRRYRAARTVATRPDRRTDVDFVDAVSGFAGWFGGATAEPRTAALLEDLQALAAFYTGCFNTVPDFRELWRLAHPPQRRSMEAGSSNLRPYRCKESWRRVRGPADGERLYGEGEGHFATVDRCYRELRGQIADALVGMLSLALDDVIAAYTRRKRDAAALDFDDLLFCAHALVSKHETVRKALGSRYRHIFVDEFQDTDGIQAAIVFLIAGESRPERWQDVKLRAGSLFLVGDPKQAIYRFRGADIRAYNEARATVERQHSGNVIEVTANFRSQPGIINHVNRCFEPVLKASGQPGYVKLSPTLGGARHGLPPVASVRIDLPSDSLAGVQRDAEAEVIAKICRRLIGAIQVERADGSIASLAPGDIALLAPTGTELWRYERALEAEGLAVSSQAGRTLLLQQETQDVLALLRALADPGDTLALGAFMRGPMVGMTDEELLDIAESVSAGSGSDGKSRGIFDIRTPLQLVSNPVAKSVLEILQHLRRRAGATTPRILLSEAIEQLQLRVVLAARRGSRSARALGNLDALIEMARSYDVSGLNAFVRALQSDWERRTPRPEGRTDASSDAVELVTIHSSKGLEWPVVIPINTSTVPRPPAEFVHRKSDNTLHWVIGGITPPALESAREEESLQEGLEHERLWYVACTRARDLLVIPELPASSSQSWAKMLDLGHGFLPNLTLEHLPDAVNKRQGDVENAQTAERFATEAESIRAASPALTWRRPSDHDHDRAEILEPVVQAADGPSEFEPPLGAGRLRGVVLHKLMEEFLTGQIEAEDLAIARSRAECLLEELLAAEEEHRATGGLPEPIEMAATALSTLGLPEVAALRPYLVAELPVWGKADGSFLSGRADAVAIQDGKITAVLDWKSDIAPSQEDRAAYIGQLAEYLALTSAPAGAVVFMTLREVVWVNNTPPAVVRGGVL